ncbi:MAG TPA: MBL fold metallo-hydrolase [Rhabdochlamydiaceae bacterium]
MILKKDGRFVNPHVEDDRRTLMDVIRWKTGFFKDHVQDPVAPKSFSYPLPKRSFNPEGSSAMWINHSTYLISINGINILTDPIWSQRCSPIKFLGPKRNFEAPIGIDQLPKIDFVLISHNHYDHLDEKTVMQLFHHFRHITWIVPTGVKEWFTKRGITRVVELSWWENHHFHGQMRVTAVPAQHFSGRTNRDLNRTLWAGYVCEFGPKRFYFVGDTGYNPHDFKRIGHTWKEMDLSLIPIGSYLPRRFMSPVHIDPYDAVCIHKEVGSKFSLGMHWKTFNLSDEKSHQPPYDLLQACKKEAVDPASFLPIEPGHIVNW